MHISNNNHTYNTEIKKTVSKTTDRIISTNASTTKIPLSYSQLFTKSVRQLAYLCNTGYTNKLMSAAEFKDKLRNNEKFCPDTFYVVYAELPKEKQVRTIPSIGFTHTYNYFLNPSYDGTLDLSDLSDTEANNLPNRLHVKGSLNLYKSNIYKLPEELIVDEDLNISECHNLTELPEKLRVNYLIDAHKSGIKHLNTKFIAGELNVSKCIDLKEIPQEPLNVYSDINFENCPKIKHLPNWIISLARMPSNNERRSIYLDGTKISYNEVKNNIEKFKKTNMKNLLDVKIFLKNGNTSDDYLI
jgi:hypothetical protein